MPKEGGGGRSSGGGGRKGRERFQWGGGGPLTPTMADVKLQGLGVKAIPLSMLKADGTAVQIAEMLPAGSKLLGQGNEAIGFLMPDGTVMRVAPMNPVSRLADASVMIQPISTTMVGKTTVERLPFVEPASGMSNAMQLEGKNAILAKMPAGYFNDDLHAANYGKSASGQWVALDPGAIIKGDSPLTPGQQKRNWYPGKD